MLVEFTGCAGAGKTSLACAVAAKLRQMGVRVVLFEARGGLRSDARAFPWFLLFAVRNFGLCSFIVRVVIHHADSCIAPPISMDTR